MWIIYIKKTNLWIHLIFLYTGIIQWNAHQDMMKRRFRHFPLTNRRHCFQFTFLTTHRNTGRGTHVNAGHVSVADGSSRGVGRTGGPRGGSSSASSRMAAAVWVLTGWCMRHVTDDSYTSSIKMKLIMKSVVSRQFILQVNFHFTKYTFFPFDTCLFIFIVGLYHKTEFTALSQQVAPFSAAVAADVWVFLRKLLVKLVPMDTDGTAADVEHVGGASGGNKNGQRTGRSQLQTAFWVKFPGSYHHVGWVAAQKVGADERPPFYQHLIPGSSSSGDFLCV